MIYWFVFLLISLLLAFVSTSKKFDHKTREISKFLLITTVICFSGFRDGLGQDYEGYYLNLYEGNYLDITYYEPLLALIANLIYYTNISPHFFFLFCALFTNILFFKSFYRYENVFIIIFIYLTGTIFFFNTFNLVRQMFAASIFMYSVKYIEKKMFIKYFICILIASTMHISSLFLIPLFFIINKMYPHFIYFIILVLSIVLGQVITIDLVPYLSKFVNLYEIYLQSDTSDTSGLLTLFFNLYLIVFIIFKKSLFTNSRNIIAFNLFFIAVVLYNLIPSFFYIFRFAIYFIIFAPIVLPFLGKIIGKRISDSILILIFGSILVFFLYNGLDNDSIVPNKLLPLSIILD